MLRYIATLDCLLKTLMITFNIFSFRNPRSQEGRVRKAGRGAKLCPLNRLDSGPAILRDLSALVVLQKIEVYLWAIDETDGEKVEGLVHAIATVLKWTAQMTNHEILFEEPEQEETGEGSGDGDSKKADFDEEDFPVAHTWTWELRPRMSQRMPYGSIAIIASHDCSLQRCKKYQPRLLED